MNNKITIASLLEVIKNLDYIKRNNINLISIRDTTPSEYYNNLYKMIDEAGIKNVFVAYFDDIVAPLPNRNEIVPNKEEIKKIIDWTKNIMGSNSNDIIVHCTGGVSRSSAVAILIKYMQNPESALSVINPMLHSPNEKIIEIGGDILGDSGLVDKTNKLLLDSDEDFKNNLSKNKKDNSSIF